MVKIFIGNLSQNAEKEEIEALFAQYGTVTECAKYKNYAYAFVHMDDRKSATKAIRELHMHKLHGRHINVEPSRPKNRGPAKLHVANVEKGYDDELRALFEEYGTVTECAIIKNFAFVHMANSDEAMDAIKGLDYSEFHGKCIHVQISKSRPRGGPGMEDFGPPQGYYPPRYAEHRPEPPYRGRMPAFPTPPPPPASPPRQPGYQPGCLYGERDVYGALLADCYKYTAAPYSAPAYDRPSPIPPPPSPSGVVREHLAAPPHGPYGLHPLSASPAYCGRDRSPHRRAPPALAANNGYSYEGSLLSPVSGPPVYGSPHLRDPFVERVDPTRYASYWEPRKYKV